eukprot:855423-Rhodomonas_salina.1
MQGGPTEAQAAAWREVQKAYAVLTDTSKALKSRPGKSKVENRIPKPAASREVEKTYSLAPLRSFLARTPHIGSFCCARYAISRTDPEP